MSEKKNEAPITEVMTYHGKPIKKLSWKECKLETDVQKWFSKRMHNYAWNLEWGNKKRREYIEEAHKVTIPEAEKKVERGEMTAKELEYLKAGIKRRETGLKKNEARLEFLYMHMYQALAIADKCQERQNYCRKPRQTPKKRKEPYNPRKFNSRKAKPRKTGREAAYWLSLYRYQAEIERRSLDTLWDKNKFLSICADRGYGSKISVEYMMSQTLNITQYMVEMIMDKGCFTWGQVLALGAVLEMTPKEFADTFLSGYFTELADGDFRASFENLPDGLASEIPMKPSNGADLEEGGTK